MKENGSPSPIFDFDESSRNYFKIILPAHPQYIVIHALRESAHLWAIGERQRALSNLEAAANNVPNSGILIAQLISYQGDLGNLLAVEQQFAILQNNSNITERHLPFLTTAKIFIDHKQTEKAAKILAHMPVLTREEDLIELAVLKKRLES
jgi:ATP-dependent DNA helicase RecG